MRIIHLSSEKFIDNKVVFRGYTSNLKISTWIWVETEFFPKTRFLIISEQKGEICMPEQLLEAISVSMFH
jgi:hypothetical protein